MNYDMKVGVVDFLDIESYRRLFKPETRNQNPQRWNQTESNQV